jgi:hypothetical protein
VLIGSLVCYPSLDSNSLIQNPYPIVIYLYPSTFIPLSLIYFFIYPSPPPPVLIVHSHPPSQTSPTTTPSSVLPFSFIYPHLLYPPPLSYLGLILMDGKYYPSLLYPLSTPLLFYYYHYNYIII